MNVNWQPLLENDLLILRPLKAEDFDALFKVASDPLIWDSIQPKTALRKRDSSYTSMKAWQPIPLSP